MEQLRAVRRAGCCSSTIVPQRWLCLMPAWSHGPDEHPRQSPGQLWLAAMCQADVLAVDGVLNFSQEREVTYNLYWEPSVFRALTIQRGDGRSGTHFM